MQYTVYLKDLNNYLPIFYGSNDNIEITEEDLNKIVLYSVTHSCYKHTMMLKLDFESKQFYSVF